MVMSMLELPGANFVGRGNFDLPVLRGGVYSGNQVTTNTILSCFKPNPRTGLPQVGVINRAPNLTGSDSPAFFNTQMKSSLGHELMTTVRFLMVSARNVWHQHEMQPEYNWLDDTEIPLPYGHKADQGVGYYMTSYVPNNGGGFGIKNKKLNINFSIFYGPDSRSIIFDNEFKSENAMLLQRTALIGGTHADKTALFTQTHFYMFAINDFEEGARVLGLQEPDKVELALKITTKVYLSGQYTREEMGDLEVVIKGNDDKPNEKHKLIWRNGRFQLPDHLRPNNWSGITICSSGNVSEGNGIDNNIDTNQSHLSALFFVEIEPQSRGYDIIINLKNRKQDSGENVMPIGDSLIKFMWDPVVSYINGEWRQDNI